MVDTRDGRYAIDVRVFFGIITLTMAASFLAGVTMVPPDVPVVAPPDASDALLNVSIDDNSENHRPSGQHLLVDIKNVDGEFLNSEERLSKAMVDTVKDAGLTLLSYHCHALLPKGVSCVGVLLESHISFHTWPDEGVITLDLFTCGDNPLLPVVQTIERLFGIGDNIHSQWSHELRGFRPKEEVRDNYLAGSSDLSLWVLSPLEMHSKKQIYSGMTKFQRVDIWDVVEGVDTPSMSDIIKYNMTPDDARLQSPEFVTPDRFLFLNGTIQSLRSSERVYHEAVVHPAMFAHANPKNVAVVGGGEGATLREVLKHKTVDSAVMIEIDEEMVQISQQYLPDFSDCSDLVGRAARCLDDDKVSVYYEDGRKWFIERYGESPSVQAQNKFDVVIVDALDPEEEAVAMYSDKSFVDSMVNSLSDDGVLVFQVGTADQIDDPKADFGIYKTREALFRLLEANEEVGAMLVYEEPYCGFLEPHSFLIVCKSADCRSRWYARSDQVDYEIYDRIVRTHSKKRALTYYDGTTQRSYQWPKKGWETVYCRREPMPFECAFRDMDPKAEVHELVLDDEEASSFRVETTGEGENKVSRVFAKKDIRGGSFIMSEHLASSLMVTDRNLEGLKNNLDVGGGRVAIIEDMLKFFDNYAHKSNSEGSGQNYVEVGASVLMRRVEDPDFASVKRWMPEHPSGKRPKYSPVYERHRMSFDVFLIANKYIRKGEELTVYKDW